MNDDSVKSRPANENKNKAHKSKYFKVDIDSPYITSLKVICRNGHIIYMPYSHQPIIEYVPDKGIYIKTMQKEILISGRGLIDLSDMLGMQKVTWIKESSNGKDDDSESIFIDKIEVYDPA